MIIPIFIPHGGCPERCTFCEQKISGGAPVSIKDVQKTIDDHLATDNKHEAIVAFYGGTFTALNQRTQRLYLDAVRPYFDRGVAGLRIATRPDAIDADWIHTLVDHYKLQTVELGVQSFSRIVLQGLGRSHSIESIYESTKTLKTLGVEVGYHLMYGCPGEATWPEERLRFQQHLLALQPDFVRLHPLLVLRSTALEQSYAAGIWAPLALETAVERGAELLEDLQTSRIPVVRIGLQANEVMDAVDGDSAIIAGPYHPAFGELVRARRYRHALFELITKKCEQSTLSGPLEAEVLVASQEASALKGQHSINLNWLRQQFPLLKLTVHVVEKPRNKDWIYENFEIRIRHIHRSA